ncbi:MAG: hypothetical protein M1838_003201 [Thelocarpon superellum]|nr:MAG: hypothetical protein M1838_003201 [Thelocarpon superellum]
MARRGVVVSTTISALLAMCVAPVIDASRTHKLVCPPVSFALQHNEHMQPWGTLQKMCDRTLQTAALSNMGCQCVDSYDDDEPDPQVKCRDIRRKNRQTLESVIRRQDHLRRVELCMSACRCEGNDQERRVNEPEIVDIVVDEHDGSLRVACELDALARWHAETGEPITGKDYQIFTAGNVAAHQRPSSANQSCTFMTSPDPDTCGWSRPQPAGADAAANQTADPNQAPSPPTEQKPPPVEPQVQPKPPSESDLPQPPPQTPATTGTKKCNMACSSVSSKCGADGGCACVALRKTPVLFHGLCMSSVGHRLRRRSELYPYESAGSHNDGDGHRRQHDDDDDGGDNDAAWLWVDGLQHPLACPCNTTYVSHGCCGSSGLIWEPAGLRLGGLVDQP